MDDITSMYIQAIDEYRTEIKEVDKKAQRAMRVTLWLKIILAVATLAAVGSWLKNHQAKELWAIIIIGSKLADVMLDTLPYMQQRITLPQMKIKLVSILLEVENDKERLASGLIDQEQALDRLFSHREAWAKSLS